MFTGIVQALGRVHAFQRNSFGAKLIIDPAGWDYAPAHGDSIAINGVCLTYTPPESDKSFFAFDVIQETLTYTNLGSLAPGDRVNLESCLTPTTPMGGHFVQGHIDGLGKVVEIYDGADEWRTTIQADPTLMPYIIPKGSITLDGVSLTLASVSPEKNQFTVALIPTTLELTTLKDRQVGSTINIESDILARTVVHWLANYADGTGTEKPITLDSLRENGFA